MDGPTHRVDGSGTYWGHDERRKPCPVELTTLPEAVDEILELGHRLPRGMTNVFVNHDILRSVSQGSAALRHVPIL